MEINNEDEEILDDTIKSEDESFVDDFEDDDEVVEENKLTKILNWAKSHKKGLIIGGVAGLVGTLLGGKLFSKTEIKEVIKEPDPTIMDKYDRIPVEEHSFIDYKYVLKDEHKDE